jgi:hypothetical protein
VLLDDVGLPVVVRQPLPVIPAALHHLTRPHLLVWKDEKHDGEIMEAVRLAHGGFSDLVELKRTDGSTTLLHTTWRMLPRNGGRALFLLCPHCETPRRYVYGWEWNRFSGRSNVVLSVSWRCRSCARLRYSSEGGYLRPTGLGRLGVMLRAYGNLPRPESWLPHVFTSIDDPRLDEIVRQNHP